MREPNHDPDAPEPINRGELPARPRGGLRFFAIGEGEPSDASERVDEVVADAIARRHDESSA